MSIVVGLLWALILDSATLANDRLVWSPVTTWTDGRVLTPSEQEAVRYRLYVGATPTPMLPVSPDVSYGQLLVSSLPWLQAGRYVSLTAVMNGEESAMSPIIRYASPGEVLGMTLATVGQTTWLSWRPVQRYQDGQPMTPADQGQVRYRLLIGQNRPHLHAVVEALRDPPLALNTVPELQRGQFVAMMAYLPRRDGPVSKAERWQVPRAVSLPLTITNPTALETDPCDDGRSPY